jgi:hypothetical protein
MQRLIFNGFMVVLGKGWGGALLSYVFSKSASLRKGCGKHAERLAEKLKPLIFKGFTHFITHITVKRKCIEKIGFLSAKIVPTD